MQVTVSARHGHLDDATQPILQEKAETLLRFFDRLTSIGVTVDLHRDHAGKVKVEIIAKAEHKHEFVSTEEDEDVAAALHAAGAEPAEMATIFEALRSSGALHADVVVR